MATVNDSISALLGQTRMPALFRQPAAPRMPTPAAPPAPAAAMPAPMQAQPQPEVPATPRVTASDIMATQEEEFGTRQGLLERQGDILAAEAEFKAGAAAERAGGMAAGEQAFRAELQPTVEQLREANRIAAEQRFAPSQRTAQENMALFGLIGVLGAAIGAGGKKNSMAALSAMNGMVEGVRRGDMDRYNREKQVFDTNLRNMRDTARSIESELKNVIVPLATSNKEEARLKLQELLARKEASFLKQYADKFALPQLIKLSEDISKGLDRAFSEAQRLEAKEAETRTREAGRVAAAQARAERPAAPERAVAVMTPEGPRSVVPSQLPPLGSGATQVTPITGRGGSVSGAGGAVQFRYNQAMTNAGLQLATAVQNFADVPMKSAPPLLAETLTNPTKGVSDAIVQFLGQKITQEDSRAVQQILAGMSRAITTIEASGRPSGATEASIKEFGKVSPRAGDAKISYYLFLAESKQVMEILVKDLIAAGANQAQIDFATKARDEVAKVVTWNVKDINRILASGRERLVNDRIREQLQTSDRLSNINRMVGKMEGSVAGAPSAAPSAPPVPSDTGPYTDAEKERRYQEWKARQTGVQQ